MALLEISMTLPNRPGTLARVARVLATERINVSAISVDSTPTKGRVRLIVSDPKRARRLLEQAGYPVELREMLAVRLEDRAGSFLKVLETLADSEVSVQSVAILLAREGGQVLVAISTTNMTTARRCLENAGFASEKAEKLVSNSDLLAMSPAIPSESVGMLL
jgi:hypothetical protein